MPTRIRARALVALAAAALLALVAAPAQAHTALVSASPPDGAVLAELTSVRLEFTEALLDVGNSVVVTDATGETHDLPLSFPRPEVLEAAVPALPAGTVVIVWRVVAADGHDLSDTISVTLAPPATPSASPSPTSSPTASPSPTATQTAEQPSPSPSPSSPVVATDVTRTPPWVWVVIGALVIAIAIAGTVAARRGPSS